MTAHHEKLKISDRIKDSMWLINWEAKRRMRELRPLRWMIWRYGLPSHGAFPTAAEHGRRRTPNDRRKSIKRPHPIRN